MRKIILPTLVALSSLLLTLFPATGAERTTRPNMIFILVDDLRWDGLGCTGHPFAKTPHIDRIAKEGALFKNFFVSIPLCSPSRSSFLTGQYAHITGITHNGSNPERMARLVTFPKLLRDAGYQTAYVGKWHMGTNESPQPGFDEWISFKGQGVYRDPNINMNGKSSKVEGYMTDILTGYAVNFIKQKHEKPFVLYWGHKAVHGPFTPAERHRDLYAGEKLPLKPNHRDTLEGKPALTGHVAWTAERNKKRGASNPPSLDGFSDRHEEIMLQQLRAMASVDDGVGEVFKALEETGQLDNTLLIFTSDNGYFWGEHRLGDKRWAYEESIRDPLVMRYPKLIKPGTVIEPLAMNIDIAPTLLDIGGAPIPKSIHGRSLVPLFKSPNARWRNSILTEYFLERGFPGVPTWQSVRTTRWKFIHYTEVEGVDELYDLEADPYELKNLIKEESARATLKKLQRELAKLLKETGGQ